MSFYFSCVIIYFRSLVLLLAVMTVWIPFNKFATELQRDLQKAHSLENTQNGEQDGANNSLRWTDVYAAYIYLKEICHYVNKAFGPLFTLYLVNSLVTQASGLDAALIIADIFVKIRLLVLIVVSACTFIIAADASDKVKTNYFKKI